jgi:hypothetical protein
MKTGTPWTLPSLLISAAKTSGNASFKQLAGHQARQRAYIFGATVCFWSRSDDVTIGAKVPRDEAVIVAWQPVFKRQDFPHDENRSLWVFCCVAHIVG